MNPLLQKTGPYIQTYFRKRLTLDFRPDDIVIVDIARGLANTARFRGQTKHFYSVAEHSIRVAHLAAKFAELWNPHPDWEGYWSEVALWGLLHDAAEAYLSDIASPFKRLPELAGYRDLESRLQEAIVLKYSLSPVQPAAVTWADGIMVNTEADQLLPGGRLDPADGWPDYPAIEQDLKLGMSPQEAEMKFLVAFVTLRNKQVSKFI